MLERPKDNARTVAQVCDLLDSAAALADVPLLALVVVLNAQNKINPKAWTSKEVFPELKANSDRTPFGDVFHGDWIKVQDAVIPYSTRRRKRNHSTHFEKLAKENNYVIETDGEKIKLVRVSTSTLRKRYRSGLNTFWAFLIKNLYVPGPAPDFSSTSKYNPPAIERDAFEEEELFRFLSTPLFTGCAGISRVWNVGGYFCQTYFYWAVLIQLLCGLRPAEIAQLRCADIAALYGEWHFRFAKRSLAEGDDDEDHEEGADTDPGGNDAKTKNAFRWVPIHPLLDKLGIIARRDAIVADYIKVLEAGGQERSRKRNVRR